MDIIERFLKYVSFDTQSSETSGTHPLSAGQLVLARALDPKVFPELDRLVGKELIVTDGTTLLGADDKIGLAVLVTLAEELLGPGAPSHREIRFCFTPDEEIGQAYRIVRALGVEAYSQIVGDDRLEEGVLRVAEVAGRQDRDRPLAVRRPRPTPDRRHRA